MCVFCKNIIETMRPAAYYEYTYQNICIIQYILLSTVLQGDENYDCISLGCRLICLASNTGSVVIVLPLPTMDSWQQYYSNTLLTLFLLRQPCA